MPVVLQGRLPQHIGWTWGKAGFAGCADISHRLNFWAITSITLKLPGALRTSFATRLFWVGEARALNPAGVECIASDSRPCPQVGSLGMTPADPGGTAHMMRISVQARRGRWSGLAWNVHADRSFAKPLPIGGLMRLARWHFWRKSASCPIVMTSGSCRCRQHQRVGQTLGQSCGPVGE